MLDTGSLISLLSEMCISTNVCLEPYLRDSLFQGTNQSLINILGLLKQRVKVQDCEVVINFLVVPRTTMVCECLLGRVFIAQDNIEVQFGKVASVRRRMNKGGIDPSILKILHININENPQINSNDLRINEQLGWGTHEKIRAVMRERYEKTVRT